jgi:hypothetical protein
MAFNAQGLGRTSGTGSDGKRYVIEAYAVGGIIYYRTKDGEELVRRKDGDEIVFEIVNSINTIIRPDKE